MKRLLDKRIKKLEDKLRINQKRRIALVTYDPNICSRSEIPYIKANVVLCLPNNGRRMLYAKPMPPEGYQIKYV